MRLKHKATFSLEPLKAHRTSTISQVPV